jgi:hypothetical protein
VSRIFIAGLVALHGFAGVARGADRAVLAVVTIDSYADVKKQLGWLGMQVGQPGLAGMLESLLLMSTQGRGLAGLDVRRPLGAVVTTDGGDLAVQGFIPVKSLDGLLDSLQAVTGPVERAGDTRGLTLPSGVALDITERDGWAMVAPRGMAAQALDPGPLFAPLSENYTISVELFPHRLPEPLRLQLRMLVEQLAANAAAQGQQMDPRALGRAIDAWAGIESLAIGIAIDADKDRVFLENRTVALPGTPTALAMQGTDNGRLTVAMPQPADGKSPAISAHLVQSVPDAARREVLGMLDAALPPDSDDPLTKTITVLLREMISSVLTTGGIDAAAAVDTPVEPPRGGKQLPDVTVGVRVKDGAALEKQLKRSLAGDAGGRLLPEGVTMTFDTGKIGNATLHAVSMDLRGTDAADSLGDTLELTLAVAPEYAFLLAGGDPRQRLGSLLGPNGRVDAAAKPIAGVDVAVDRLLAYAGSAAATAEDARGDEAAGRVRLFIRPLERGVATRLAADAAALKAFAAAAAAGADDAGARLPPGLPIPNGFPIPAPAR